MPTLLNSIATKATIIHDTIKLIQHLATARILSCGQVLQAGMFGEIEFQNINNR